MPGWPASATQVKLLLVKRTRRSPTPTWRRAGSSHISPWAIGGAAVAGAAARCSRDRATRSDGLPRARAMRAVVSNGFIRKSSAPCSISVSAASAVSER
jgi:hypothetical protein